MNQINVLGFFDLQKKKENSNSSSNFELSSEWMRRSPFESNFSFTIITECL